MEWEKIQEEDSYVIELKRPLKMHSGNFRKVVNAFLNSHFIYDGVGPSGAKQIEVLGIDDANFRLTLTKLPNSKRVSIRPNPYVLNHQLDAMYALINAPHTDYLPIYRLFADPDAQLFPVFKKIGEKKRLKWNILKKMRDDGRETEGTDNQRSFVKTALSTPDFAFLEGPPGSGKTETIAELILQAVQMDLKILLVTHTHAAVDNVLERVKNHDEVVAIRISANENKVDETVKQYHISHRRATEKERLIDCISAQSQTSKAQEYFASAVREDDEITTDIILKSANLVCGTTIGILNHPVIKSSLSPPEPMYDLMILDEAGMVTFQEWLVPALYAKRWIFVGDTLQLSPHVVHDELAANIDDCLNQLKKSWKGIPDISVIKEVCLNCFYSLSDPGVVIHNNQEIFDIYKRQATSLEIDIFVLDDLDSFPEIAKDKGVLLLASPEIYEKRKDDIKKLNCWIFGDIKADNPEKSDEKTAHNEEKSWEMAIAWRKDRIYQLRHYNQGDGKCHQLKGSYNEDIDNLLPAWDNDFNKSLRNAIDEGCFVSLPSMMDLLQERNSDHLVFHKNCLTQGLRKEDYDLRHDILIYQHRSHSEIMRFSKELLYLKKGKDCLKSPSYLDKIRKNEFLYHKYQNPTVWANYRDHHDDKEKKENRNSPEAEHLIDHLVELVEWAKSHAPPEGRNLWEFTALTFYSNQETLLKKRISERFQLPGKRIIEIGDSIRIRIATVETFQGHEADVILLSMVNTDKVGFLDALGQLNVALTRARNWMVIFGKKKFYKSQELSPMLSELARDENPYYMILELARRDQIDN